MNFNPQLTIWGLTSWCLEHLLATIPVAERGSLVVFVVAAGFELTADRCSSNLRREPLSKLIKLSLQRTYHVS